MPDHIIEEIYIYSDLADRKSLSETCMRMNSIFSSRRILGEVWLNVGHQTSASRRALTNGIRVYRKLILNTDLSTSIWNHLSPHLTSLRVDFSTKSTKSICASLINGLKVLTNLTHLDFTVCYMNLDDVLNEMRRIKHQRKAAEPVTLERLEYLRVSYMFFALFYNVHVKFTTDKLSTFILINDNSLFHISQSEALTKARTFIQSQTNLENLHMQVPCQLFSVPFVINTQLKELKMDPLSGDLNLNQQQNIINFVKSSNKLEVLDITTGLTNNNATLGSFRTWTLNQKLKRMEVVLSVLPLNYQRFDVNSVAANHLELGEPNHVVKELDVSFRGHFQGDFVDIPLVFRELTTKFPELSKIIISSHLTINFPPIDSLHNITELTYRRNSNDNLSFLESNLIPNLKHFGFACQNVQSLQNSTEAMEIFISRHVNSIETIHISLRSFAGDQNEIASLITRYLIQLVEFALQNIDGIRKITVSSLNHEEIWSRIRIQNRLSEIIDEHAKSSFTYRSPSEEIFKRCDNKIVRKQGGRWIVD